MERSTGPRGRGRPPGSRNKRTVETQERVAASGMTPLEYLTSVYQDVSADEGRRIDAAKAAAPYVHAKLSQIDARLAGADGGPIETVTRIELIDGDGED
jgi:hypothetical protein